MATTPTNKPIPSEDPRDLKFNAGKIDEAVTSEAHYYTDRFGVRRWTIAGFQYTAEEAIRNYGYITMDSFEDGATLTLPNQVLRYEATGEYYRWDGDFPKIVPAGSTPDSTGEVKLGAWVSVGDASLRKQSNNNDYNLWFEILNSYGITLKGTFESGFDIDGERQAGLYLYDGMVYVRKNNDSASVPPGSHPDGESWIPLTSAKGKTIFVGVSPFNINEENSAQENDAILEKLARYIESQESSVNVLFPKGKFTVGSQELSGAFGMGGSYIPNQKCTVRNFQHQIHYQFFDTEFVFADGLRVGGFDPVTGEAMTSIQTNMDYRANRGILFGFTGCPTVSVSGRIHIDFNGANAVLGSEFGDSGYQCPEYGFWFIDHKTLIFDAHYTAEDGAMDALYLAGLNGDDCYSRVTNFSFNKMGRSAFVIGGGENIYVSGKAFNSGLGSIQSSPGHNFAIESEVRRVANVTLDGIMSNEALFAAFSIYNPSIDLVKDIRVVNSELSNATGIVCKSNTPNVKYINCTLRGVVGQHRNEFFNHSIDERAAEMINCSHYDQKTNFTPTAASNGTHFDSSQTVRLTLKNYRLFSNGFSSGRGTIGALYEPILDDVTLTINGDITFAATAGLKIFDLQNPVSMRNVDVINRTTGSGGADMRAFIGITNIDNCIIDSVQISSTGQLTETILWNSNMISAGGRAGYLLNQSPIASPSAFRFIAIGVAGHLSPVQNIAGYMRTFVVQDVPVSGDFTWIAGDYLIRANPQPGQIYAWRCTTGGKAGSGAVFKSMGTLSS